jgi:hypothetical protein
MPAKIKDIAGQRFGKWLVLNQGDRRANSQVLWLCRCDCGNEREIRGGTLRQGLSKSCGACLERTPNLKHGLSRTRGYHVWRQMIDRCENSGNKDFHHYGGRGIEVCARWRNGVEAFITDMGMPADGLTLDRIDVNGSYEPGNCRWVSHKEQTRNARSNIQLTHEGKTQCLGAWAEELGMKYSTLYGRVVTRGWPADQALTTPVMAPRT